MRKTQVLTTMAAMSLTEPTFKDDVENLITEDSADVSQSGGTASSPFSSIHFLQVYKVGVGPAMNKAR